MDENIDEITLALSWSLLRLVDDYMKVNYTIFLRPLFEFFCNKHCLKLDISVAVGADSILAKAHNQTSSLTLIVIKLLSGQKLNKHSLFVLWKWGEGNHLISFSLSFLICKMGIIQQYFPGEPWDVNERSIWKSILESIKYYPSTNMVSVLTLAHLSTHVFYKHLWDARCCVRTTDTNLGHYMI